jgi:uncharacterized membrane protein
MLALTGQQLIGSLVGLVTFLFTLYALIDALRKPSRAYDAAGVSRTLWIVLLVVSLFIPCGIVLTLWWLFSTGPRVGRQAQIGGIGFPGR